MLSKKINKKENPLIRFFTLVRKELALILADKQALLLVFILPLAATYAVGFTGAGMGADGSPLDTLVAGRGLILGTVNEDLSNDTTPGWGGEFLTVLGEQPDTTLVFFENESAANESLFYEHVMGYVVIRDGFHFNVSAHLPGLVEFYADSLNILAQPLIAKKVNDAIGEFKQKFNFTEDELEYQTVQIYGIDSPLFVSLPMIVVITLLASGLMLACQSVVGDNPLNRMILTPAGKFEILVSKVTAYTMLHMIQALFLLIPPMLSFNITFMANFFAVWGYLGITSFAGVCYGLFFSTVAKTKLQGSQFFLLGFMLVFILGGGMFLPEGTLDLVFPMIHAMTGVLRLAYKDMAFQYIWPTIWPQLLFGLAFFIAAFLILRARKVTI
ncbi:MAG: ABC transporter permease [Promethearchaeota archaeon]